MYMYIACTYMFMPVRNFVNMYIHVCTMYRDVCTDLPILVQVVRIPDAVQPGTYRLVLRYRIIVTCTAPFEYVLFPPSTYSYILFSQVRTQYVLGQIVCTEYVLSTESMIKVRTLGEKYKLS